MDAKEAYGILYFPSEFSKNIHKGKQATVSLYCDMSALLFYKAFLLATTEVSLEIGKELRAQNNPSSTIEQEKITINPIPYESVALFNSQNGFASFLVPAILILVIQQTLILGIGMLGGTAREKNRFHSLVPQVAYLYIVIYSRLYLGIRGGSEIIFIAAGGRAVDCYVVCSALSVRVHLFVDDFVRFYDKPRVADAGLCLYFGYSVVYLRRVLAQRSDTSLLESGWLSVSFHTWNTGIYPYQYGRSLFK